MSDDIFPYSLDDISDTIKSLFMRKVIEDLEEDRDGIHVSDLVYPCVRKSFFNMKYGGRIEYDDDGETKSSTSLTEREIMTFWIGKKIHELPITKMHEIPVEYMGVKGTFDEALWINGNFIIIDKKTSSKLPSRPYEHHKTQIKMYAYMYWKTMGEKAKYGAVIYILKDTSMANTEIVRVFTFPITDEDYKVTKHIFETRLNALLEALRTDVPPERVPTFLCRYCHWQELCFRHGTKKFEIEGV